MGVLRIFRMTGGVRLSLFVGVVLVSLVIASSASADTPSMVVGTGYTTNSGQVTINARATGPIDLHNTRPATGFIRVSKNSFYGTVLTGTVTCIGGFPDAPAWSVSGVLDEPHAGTVQNFTFLKGVLDWYAFFPSILDGVTGPSCGTFFFGLQGFDGFGPIEPWLLQYGNFVAR